MKNPTTLSLPLGLEPYRKPIEKSVQPFIRIQIHTQKPAIFQSKFGGNPYLPKGMAHPLDENGKPMRLLAQYDMEALPSLPYLPKKGMLQFFLSVDDEMMGLDLDRPTHAGNFRVIYHPDVVRDASLLISDFSYIPESDDEAFPVEKELSLSFNLSYEAVSTADYRFETLMDGIDTEEVLEEGKDDYDTVTVADVFAEQLANDGHKIGGYAFFTQDDPRGYDTSLGNHDILLLQIDSESDTGIMWGDMGVGQFFIRKEDLKRLDFSNVLYNWDCS